MLGLVKVLSFVVDLDDPDSRLDLVVVGLFALAAVIIVTTGVYWRLTRPGPRHPEREPTEQ